MTYLDCKNKVLKLLNDGFSVYCYLLSKKTLLCDSSADFHPWRGFVSYGSWKRTFDHLFDAFLLGCVPSSVSEDSGFNSRSLFFYYDGGDENGKRD